MSPTSTPSPPVRRWVAVMWPAFLAACALEVMVFAAFDPEDFHAFGADVVLSREAVLSVAFFGFWFITSATGYATWKLAGEP